ncbi:MAG: PLP-dependent aminotransferase family protein [Mycobacteriales bacterium]
MSNEWTSSASEVLLGLTELPARGRRAALEAALREAVRAGRLPAGQQLPSSRALATDLGLARGTVVEAYAQLVAEGYLTTRPGGATLVAAGAPAPAPAAGPPPAPATRAVDLYPGRPDVRLFPRQAWARALRQVLATLPAAALSYGDPAGHPVLREALAGLLARRRGVVAGADRVLVGQGVGHGLALVAAWARQAGHTAVAVEDPGSPPIWELLIAHGLRPVPLPVDAGGLDPDRLAALTGVRLAMVTPAHQFPTGSVLAPDRRRALVAWADRVDGLVLEDDYDGDFRYDRAPVGALQALAPERVVYVGSASKSLAPALRLGWLVAPFALVGEVAAERRHHDLMTPVLDQLAFAELIRSGAYDRHLRLSLRTYRERRETVQAVLAATRPDWTLSGIAAGLHVLAEVGEDAPALVARAAAAGIRVPSLATYSTTAAADALVLGYAHLRPAELTPALHALAAV